MEKIITTNIEDMTRRKNNSRTHVALFIIITVLFNLTALQRINAQTTLVRSVSASSDDAEEAGTGADIPIGTTYLNSTDLELVRDVQPPPLYGNQTIGIRFINITIPKGAYISDAYLTFRAVAADPPMTNSETTNLTFRGHLSANSTTFTSALNNISSRTTTTASAIWSTVPAWTTGLDYNSPGLANIIQELVNQGSWVSGNALSIIITGTGHRSAESWDDTPTNPPKLTIAYCYISASVGTTTICGPVNNGTITVSNPSGGSGSYQYRLDNGTWQSSSSFTGLATGSYSVQIRDANNTSCVTVLGTYSITTGTSGSMPTYDNTSALQTNSGSTVTVGHATGSGSNRLMLVGVSTRDRVIDLTGLSPGEETSNVTYAGNNLVFVGTSVGSTDADKDAVTYIFMLLNPPTGTANASVTFTSSLADNNRATVGVTTYSNVDQTSPIGAYQVANGNDGSPSLTQTSTNTGQVVFNVLAATNATVIPTLNNSQTQRWLENTGRPTGAGYTLNGAGGSTSSSYTIASQRWSLSGVAINPVLVADLGISKTVSNTSPYSGETITFTLTAQNNGCDNAPNVTVTDQLPSGYTYQSHSTTTGSYNPGSGLWNIGTLNNGASASLTISGTVLSAGTYTNTATITGDVLDSISGNDSASAGITVCQAGPAAPIFK